MAHVVEFGPDDETPQDLAERLLREGSPRGYTIVRGSSATGSVTLQPVTVADLWSYLNRAAEHLAASEAAPYGDVLSEMSGYLRSALRHAQDGGPR